MGKMQKKDKQQKKQIKKYILWGAGAVLVLALAVMPMIASGREDTDGPTASILSADAQIMDIDTQIIGGGQLSSEASLSVRIPENVKLTEYLVGNGDVVSEGDPIAKVDKISVMTAITQVQDTLDYLSGEIADAGTDSASDTVKALAGGTVKIIYAEEGEAVQDVMLEHGSLAVLSLDGTMAVRIQRETTLDVGDRVCVEFSDGTETDGRVKNNLGGVLTITVEDDDYPVGAKVTVSTEDGDRLGSGELYIFSQWNATAYSGTVEDILVKENQDVYVGQTMFSLENPGNTAQFQRLIDQRQEYEALMLELFTMYRTETITAPCDGIVTGVDKNGVYLLSDDGEGWFASLLSFFGKNEEAGFVAYAAAVTAVSDDGMELLLDPAGYRIGDFASLAAVPADISAMTTVWNYCGDTTIYTQSEDGLLCSAGTAKAGDILLAVGDEEQVRWFVVLNGTGTSSQEAAGTISLCSAQETAADIAAVSEVEIQSCTGTADCTYAPHDSNCKSRCDLSENCPAASHKDGCVSQKSESEPVQTSVSIITASLNQGVVGQIYNSPLQASDGTNVLSGTWTAEGLPVGLTIAGATGVISGTPTEAGSYQVTICFTYQGTPVVKSYTLTITAADTTQETYLGYVAQVVQVIDGSMIVKQTTYSYTITDLNNLPTVQIDANALTEEMTYVSALITEQGVSENDYLLIVVEQDGTLKHFVKLTQASEGNQSGTPGGGAGSAQGGMTSGGGSAGSQTQAYEMYTLDKLTIASVTSQEHMTVSITIDELDITKIYVGQQAVVSVDALGGEQFDATITGIANSGENDGGNSKFTVELSLSRSGDMLPGMYSSAFITLETAKSVTCIPVAALEKDGTDSIVYTSYDQESGTLGNPVVVAIGSSDGEYVEILSGLEVGQTCYYEYYDTYIGSDAPQQGSISFNLMGRR